MTTLRVVPSGVHSTRRRRASEIVSLFREATVPAAPARLSLEDRIEIDELISEYAMVIDTARWNELPSLFAHDAVLKVRRPEAAPDPAPGHERDHPPARSEPRHRDRHQILHIADG